MPAGTSGAAPKHIRRKTSKRMALPIAVRVSQRRDECLARMLPSVLVSRTFPSSPVLISTRVCTRWLARNLGRSVRCLSLSGPNLLDCSHSP